MKKHIVNANIIYPDSIGTGFVTVEGNLIFEVGEGDPVINTGDLVWDFKGEYLSPGFVETHSHGAGGHDFMDGTYEGVIDAAKTLLSHGTTTLFPTTLAASKEEILLSIDSYKEACKLIRGGPDMPGLHMEGPYLNRNQKGAIDERYIKNPVPEEYEKIIRYANGAIARWTLAPELPGAIEFTRYLRNNNIIPSMGHSDAEYEQVLKAYRSGITHVTHLFSAMSGMVRRGGFRYPGMIESAFCIDDLTVEIIADGCHLPIEILQMVYKCKGADKIALTCDSMRCAGQDVTESILGSQENGQRVIIEDDVAKLLDRTAFAGSIATDDRLVRVMYKKAHIPLYDCVKMMTLTPAKIMGIDKEVGSIVPGKVANLVCFDHSINILGAMVQGEGVYGNFIQR